jgi:hypothetical protein
MLACLSSRSDTAWSLLLKLLIDSGSDRNRMENRARESTVSVPAPMRLLIAAVTALVIAAVIASSSAHAMLLGDAVVRSAPGAPLRVVIPLGPGPGEPVEDACFRLIPGGDTGSSMVTARVSLERAAATPRLIVTTPNAVTEPVARFAIESICGGTTRRNYSLAREPRASGTAAQTFAIVTTGTAGTREPGQERLRTAQAGTASAFRAPLETPRATPTAAGTPADANAAAVREKEAAASVPVAAGPAPAVSKRTRVAAEDDSMNLAWYLGAPIVMGVIALSVLFVTRRRTHAMPDWTRGGILTGPRSYTDMSAQPVTLSRFDPTPVPRLSTTQRPDGASLRFVKAGIAANTLRRKTPSDPSTLDTLINDTEEDKREERAVRDAWAAARRDVEEDEDNAILKAIDEAERELLFVPPAEDEAAIDRSLEDDLDSQPKRPKKAAA